MNVRNFALVLGVAYLLAGVLGFIPAMLREPGPAAPELAIEAGYGYLLGLFPVNVVHTLVHLAVGVWGIVACRHVSTARVFAKGVAVIFGVLAILGLIPGLRTLFGLVPLHGHDIWLHALTAVAAAYFGFRSGPPEQYGEQPQANAK